MSFITTGYLWLLLLKISGIVNATPAQKPMGYFPIAHTKNGSYYGNHNNGVHQDFFLGVPFAQPPIHELRLQVPTSLNTTWKGLRNATEYGFACIGYGEDTFIGGKNYVSEDCLTLNIVRPSGYEHKRLPVGVWIYGGGWYEGTSLDSRYNLSYIVEQSVGINRPIIGVSINYRLSGWGFLHSADVVKAGVANLGLRDQRLALHWLQENIGAFGGDISKVTIWGESAGAISVGNHMLAYNGRDDGLFSGAISQSGATWGVGLIGSTIEIAEQVYQNVTYAVGCSNVTEKLACLRQTSTEDLNRALNTSNPENHYQLHFAPLVDGDIIARDGIEQLQDGSFVRVPYMIGDNSDEGTAFVPLGLNTEAELIEYFEGYGIDISTITDLMRLYPDDPLENIPQSHPERFNETIGIQFKRAATIIGDIAFMAPRRLAAKAWLQHTNESLYSYRFNTIPNGMPDYLAVAHFQEVAFVFHNTEGIGYYNPGLQFPYFGPSPFAGKPQSYFDLADDMSRRWASFIHDRDPNHPSHPGPDWPKYTLSNASNIVFDANVSTFVEPDSYRKEGIEYLVDKFIGGTRPWR